MDEAIVRPTEEVDAVLNHASDGEDRGSRYPGQSYEQGIRDMWDWLTGSTDDPPLP